MKFKNILILVLFVLTLFLLGCVSVPTCGDGICSELEINPTSKYYCPNDCGKEINAQSKTVPNCGDCEEWDSSLRECVWQCTSGQDCCGEEICFDPLVESCCLDDDDTPLIFQGANLTCCPICLDDADTECKISKNSSSTTDPYSIDNCSQSKDCGTIQVACLTDDVFCEAVPNAGGVCLIKDCVIAFPNSTCELLFDDLAQPPSSVFIDSDAPTNPKTNVDGIIAECSLQHELAHARDVCECPFCGSEMNAFSVSSDCYTDAVENWGVNEEDIPYLKYKAMENAAIVNYQECLCDNKVFGENQLYKNGTCDSCEDLLKDLLNQGFDELSEDYPIGGLEKFVWVNGSLNSTRNTYCADYEQAI